LWLAFPWDVLAEDAKRSDILRLKALCGWYFVAAACVNAVSVPKGWFVSLKLACKAVGEASGLVPVAPASLPSAPVATDQTESQDGDEEDNGNEDEHSGYTAVEGEKNVVATARIIQRLLGAAGPKKAEWTAHVEKELESAWPGMKDFWRG
jgi:hypothetical protein